MTTTAIVIAPAPAPTPTRQSAIDVYVARHQDPSRVIRRLKDVAQLIDDSGDLAAVDWPNLQPDELVIIKDRLAETYSPATVTIITSCVRTLLAVYRDRGEMAPEAFEALSTALRGKEPVIALNVPHTAGVDRESNPAFTYWLSLDSDASKATMVSLMTMAANILSRGVRDAFNYPWHELTYTKIGILRQTIKTRYAHTTANSILTAVRRVLQECWRLYLIDRDTYERLADIKPIKGHREPPGRWLEQPQLKALLDTCAADQTLAGVRDRALFALSFGCGLRVSELVNLDLADYDTAGQSLLLRAAKGTRDRRAALPTSCLPVLAAWLGARGDWAGPLFITFDRGAVSRPSRRFSTTNMRKLFGRRALEAGIGKLRPHDGRRSYVSSLLSLGNDLAIVQRMAGHAKPETTSNYDRRPFQNQRTAAETLLLPV